MKQLIYFLSAFALALASQAQPTLTYVTNAPVAGSAYSLHYGPYVSPGAAGAQQIWDLEALASDSSMMVQYLPPTATPHGAQFPTATIAEVSEMVTQYFRTDATGMHFAGSDDGSVVIVHAPQGTYLPFPCTYGTSWNTPQNATFTYEGMQVVRTGNFSGTVDGYGTLLMPDGIVSNVLRVHWTHTLQDALGAFSISYVYDGYTFFAPGISHPIAELVTASTDVGGGPIVNQYSRWSAGLSTGLKELHRQEITAYPNPASDEVTISWPADREAAASITVTDMAGRTVMHRILNGIRSTSARIDVSSLFQGKYHLSLITTDGRRNTVPLIVR